MYGDLALQLVTASHRSALSTTPQLPLPKYALPLILSICLETRQLGKSITDAAEIHGQVSLSQDRGLVCNLTVQHLAARRNKRCLLAYLSSRVGGMKERWWDAGGGLAFLLSAPNPDPDAPDLRSALSPQELERPPGELMVDVRVVKDAGEVVLEGGERVEFRKGERFRLARNQVERLIVQGYLEEV